MFTALIKSLKQLFNQFDAEGEGHIDVETFYEVQYLL